MDPRPRLRVTVEVIPDEGTTSRAVFDLGRDAHLSMPIDVHDITRPDDTAIRRETGEWMHFSVSGALRRADFAGWQPLELECEAGEAA